MCSSAAFTCCSTHIRGEDNISKVFSHKSDSISWKAFNGKQAHNKARARRERKTTNIASWIIWLDNIQFAEDPPRRYCIPEARVEDLAMWVQES